MDAFVQEELDNWKNIGVLGHHTGKENQWMTYHELLSDTSAKIVGAQPEEVVIMNSLTVNLHLMMVSFYRPTATRYKILIEESAFPSDQYAVASQVKFHGFDPQDAIIEVKLDDTLADIEKLLEEEGDSIALVMMAGVNYYSGQVFDMEKITAKAHSKGCLVGFDLAHGAGNIELHLHDWNVDFAVWCTYKYLNSGPGGVAGCFIHEQHANDVDIPRFTGWWGHEKESRFLMPSEFKPTVGAEGWQLSNAPILSMASLRASLEIIEEVGMEAMLEKSRKLTGYFEFLINGLEDDRIEIITPADPSKRGCQLSICIQGATRKLAEALIDAGIIIDWREPDVVRAAPAPLYNSFLDVYLFVEILKEQLK